MKTRNTVFSVSLSLILLIFIFISAVFFVTPRIFEKETFDQILSDSKIKERIMGYENPEKEEEKTDVYEMLSENIPDQVCLALNLSGKDAALCQEGAINYVKEKGDDKYAYTKLAPFTEDLATGYTEAAIANRFIRPDHYYGYQTLQSGKVYEKERDFLKNTMISKYRTFIERFADEGLFCGLDLDQKNTFAYLLLTGRDSQDMKYGLYKKIEEKVDSIIRERYSFLIGSLFEERQSLKEIDEISFTQDIRNIISEYLESNGYSEELLNPNITEQVIQKSIHNYIYPRLYENLPSQENTLSALPQAAIKGLRYLNNDTLFYIGIGLSVLLAILIFLIARSKAPLFIGIPILLVGIVLFLTKNYTPQLTDRTLSFLSDPNTGPALFIPQLIRVFSSRLSSIGIYLMAAGAILFVLGIVMSLLKRKAS